jgi:uncharacterized protein YwqG
MAPIFRTSRRNPTPSAAAGLFTPSTRFPDLGIKPVSEEALSQIHLLARPAANLLVIDEHPSLTESKLGGTPPWPEGVDIPRDPSGKPLVFLAQIDCKHLSLPDFPRNGILQFFIGSDDVYGCAFPSVSEPSDTGTDFRVIFHEDPSILRHRLNYYEEYDLSDFQHPFRSENWTTSSYTFLPRSAWMSPHPSSRSGDDLVVKLEDQFEVDDGFALLGNDYPQAHVGGYPIYTQADIAYEPAYAEFDTVLLSLGSPDDLVAFGDAGRVNFLIRKPDLLRGDFSRVAYTWDCH